MAMKQTTPYAERPKGERERELKCMEFIFGGVKKPPLEVYEAFGGIGMTAELMSPALA